MQIKGLKHKIYIACIGMPDCGKSTFIKGLVNHITRRDVPVDSFCDEQKLDMTIRSAQIFLRKKELPCDIVLLDCPGHIFEYEDEARSVLSKAHFCIRILNDRQDEVVPYSDLYKNPDDWNKQLGKLMYDIPVMVLRSHSFGTKWNCYDAFENFVKFEGIFNHIVEFIDEHGFKPIDPVETALRVIKLACGKIPGPKTLMCSYGKDSVLLLQLLKMSGFMNDVNIEYPNSGFDLPGISDEFKKEVGDFFGCEITSFPVIETGWDFNNHTTQEMMLCKARMLTDRIREFGYRACFTGIRRDEEGTRAKEKFFSPRFADGSFNMLVPQKEIFKDEFDGKILETSHNVRVNPLLDLCEADVWAATRYFSLPVCNEYFSKNGKRYRSLGDWPITTPVDSDTTTIDMICDEIDETIVPERACRALQDKSVKFGMEKLRKVGFF